MIRYDLRCDGAHEFDAWFASSEAFDAQAASGDLACPVCGSTAVEKALMAPRVGKGAPAGERGSGGGEPGRAEADGAEKVGVAAGAGEKTEAVLAKLRAFVEANCEDVGARFPEEARRIHYGEAEKRGILGEASLVEAKELVEEGISVGRLPWRSRHDA